MEGKRRVQVDGIGCVGLLFLALMVLVAAAGVILPEEEQGVVVSATPAAIAVVSTATATLPAPTPVPETFTPVPTLAPATATATALPSATAAPATVSSLPSPSALSPTPTLEPTATLPPTPLPTPLNNITRTVRVPILMYHYISEPPEDADIYREDLSLSPQSFREQLQYLADNGYTTIDLYDLARAVTFRAALPPKPVILTFDDGYVDHYTNAFPLLQEFGFTGTFFIITEFVDAGNPNHMSWPMIEEMAAAGMRMESHSKTHPDLTEADRETVIWQILGSQETLAAHIGYTPRFFCYPGGRYDEETIAVLQELDFWGAVTTAGGKWHRYEERYEWTRLRIRYTTPLSLFIDMVSPEES